MNKFQFNPPNGLLDTNIYPTNPTTEAEARGQIQAPLNQIKDYLNLFLDDFTFNKNTNGYTRLPNGFILQWGTRSIDNNNMFTTFPIEFPNVCLSCLCNITDFSTTNTNIWGITKNGFFSRHFYDGWLNVTWIAIGY